MEIVITGSIAYDYLMRFPGHFNEHFLPEELHQISLSFLVDDMTKHWGGVASNIAFTMAKLGLSPRLMGTVGRDFGDYRDWLESAGVDCSTVIQIDEVFTASFFANTDLDNNQLAFFYGGAMNLAQNYSLADVTSTKPDLVVVSPNNPLAMSNLTQECRDKSIKFIYDPSQQVPRLSGEEMKRDMQGAYVMVVNAYEASVICDKTGMSLDDLRNTIDLLIITEGKDGSKIYNNGDIISVPAFPPTVIKDPTGAGDAFRAGLISGLVRDLPLKLAGEVGALCATYALEFVGTQNHRFSIEDFISRFRQFFDDEGQLDIFLTKM